MKRLLASLLASLVIATSAFAQVKSPARPDLRAFTVLGRIENTAFLVDNKNVVKNGAIVTFQSLAARIENFSGDKVSLDGNNYMLLTVRADCQKMQVRIVETSGRSRGVAVPAKKFTTNVQMAPEQDSPAADAMNLVCSTHVGAFV